MFIVRSSFARWRWLLGVEDIFAAIVFVYCPWTDTSLKGGRYFWYASTHYEWTVWPWKTRIKRLFNLTGCARNDLATKGGFYSERSEHLFTFQFPLTFHNNNTCNYSICKRRFEKGIFCWNILSSCICCWCISFLYCHMIYFFAAFSLFKYNVLWKK